MQEDMHDWDPPRVSDKLQRDKDAPGRSPRTPVPAPVLLNEPPEPTAPRSSCLSGPVPGAAWWLWESDGVAGGRAGYWPVLPVSAGEVILELPSSRGAPASSQREGPRFQAPVPLAQHKASLLPFWWKEGGLRAVTRAWRWDVLAGLAEGRGRGRREEGLSRGRPGRA